MILRTRLNGFCSCFRRASASVAHAFQLISIGQQRRPKRYVWTNVTGRNLLCRRRNHVLVGYADHLAYVIYTSGTTGKPKGSLIRIATWCGSSRLRITGSAFNEKMSDPVHSYAFDFSVWRSWGALLYGGRLVSYLISRAVRLMGLTNCCVTKASRS